MFPVNMLQREDSCWRFDPSRRFRMIAAFLGGAGALVPAALIVVTSTLHGFDVVSAIPAAAVGAVLVIAAAAIHLMFVRGGSALLVDHAGETVRCAGREVPWSQAGAIAIWRSVGVHKQQLTLKPAFGVGILVTDATAHQGEAPVEVEASRADLLRICKACGPEDELRAAVRDIVALWGGKVLTLSATPHGELPSLEGKTFHVRGG
ncbi:MAG: hypothetical protein AAF721_39370 [Myxococcota bacterium]